MKKKIFWIIAIILVAIVATFIKNNKNIETDTIQIGAILEFTGDYASQGENSKNGIELAKKEINEKGGILGKQIEIIYQDNKNDSPKDALSAFQYLKNQGVNLMIGPNLTPSATVLVPILEQNGVLMISPSVGSEKFGEGSKYAFDVWPPDMGTSANLAEYLFNSGYRKIAILGTQQEWKKQQAEYVKEAFEKLGGTVTVTEIPLDDNNDLRTEALKIKESNPEAIVFTNYGKSDISAIRIRELGVEVPFFSVLIDEKNIVDARGALEGTVFVTSYSPTEEFVQKYKDEYGTDPQFSSDTSYDALHVLANAIENSGSTKTKAVANELSKIKNWSGASGNFSFNEHGNAVKDSVYYVVKGDSYELHEK
jgi:branched-chain amino acid transport system substrate-binding protein